MKPIKLKINSHKRDGRFHAYGREIPGLWETITGFGRLAEAAASAETREEAVSKVIDKLRRQLGRDIEDEETREVTI